MQIRRLSAIGIGSVFGMMFVLGALSTPAAAWTLPIPASVEYTGYGDFASGYATGTQWFAADGDTGLCQWDRSSIFNPATSLFFNLYPSNVPGNGYNYQSDTLEKASSSGWYEARFTLPDLEADAYEYYKLKLFLEYFRSPDFAVTIQDAYYFGVTTETDQSLLSDGLYAYDDAPGSDTYSFWTNSSPDTGLPWTKAEIGVMELRLICHLQTVTATELIAYRFYGLAIPTTAPDVDPADVILRPNGDYYIDPEWENYPANDTYWDKVDDTTLFGDWWSTQVMTDADKSIIFDMTDLPSGWTDESYFSLTIWVVAWVDYEFEMQYPYISFGPIGALGLPTEWSDRYVVPSVRSNFSYEWPINPDTGYRWTLTELNGLQVIVDTDEHAGGYMNITQIGAVLTLEEGFYPPSPDADDAEAWDFSFASIRLFFADGGFAWIFLLFGAFLMVGTPILAVIAYQQDGYVESLGRFLIVGFIGFGLFWAGVMAG